MIIKVINPNTCQTMTDDIRMTSNKHANKDTEIIAVSPKTGPESLESYYDEYLAVPGILEEIRKGDMEENVDAYIVACFGDPGLLACREATDRPVIGIAEAAIIIANIIAPSFSIVTAMDRSKQLLMDVLRANNAENRCASIRTTNLAVLDFEKDAEAGVKALRRESLKAVKEDGAECILLGCAGFVNFVEELQESLGVPVLDGVVSAVKLAEALVGMNCKTSKVLTWGFPEPKKILGFSGLLRKEFK